MSEIEASPELNPFHPEIVEEPYEMHEKLRNAGIVRIEDGRFLVTRFEDVDFVLRRDDLFSNVPKTLEQISLEASHSMEEFREKPEIAAIRETGALPSSDPPEHTEYRKMMGPKLSLRGLAWFEPKVKEIIEDLIDEFIEDGTVELSGQFATPMTVYVFVRLLGIEEEDIPRMTVWVDDTIESMSAAVGMLDSIRIKELEASRNEFMNFLMGLVGQRRKEPRDDLLTFIINHELDAFKRTLHERELAGMLTTLLMGGTETTLNMICSGMWLLLEHPKVMQEIQEDHSLIPQFVEEALRIESPVQGLSRQAIQDTEINGTLIPKGSFIWIMYAAANRDPKNWNQPDDFNIHREELKQTMAFGKYVHYCIGAPLARMEARIAFTSLLTRLQNIHFSEKNDFTHGASHVIRGFKEMWLDFEKNQ